MLQPLYTAENVQAAYQLRWSLALFANTSLPPPAEWEEALKKSVEADHVRVLDITVRLARVWFFLLSTQPDVAPQAIVKSVKGRLEHLLHPLQRNVFRRNFSLSSLGTVSRETVESYVTHQLGHHRIADPNTESLLARYGFINAAVDLNRPTFSSHGRYLSNLHLVLVNADRLSDIREASLALTRSTFLQAAMRSRHRLSRLSLVTDHLHATLGIGYGESPQETALTYMNNLAFAHGQRAIFSPSYFVGTFGEYDLQAVRQHLSKSPASGRRRLR